MTTPSDFGGAPPLRFTPQAWAKWLFMARHRRDVEISGFAITAPNNPLLVEDIYLTDQVCTGASVELPDHAMSAMIDDLCMGVNPIQVERCCRIWLHTHPGNSPEPSHTDTTTFETILSQLPWAIMGIMAKDGSVHVRVYRRDPFLLWSRMPVAIAWDYEVTPEWEHEVETQVREPKWEPRNETIKWDPAHGWVNEESKRVDPKDVIYVGADKPGVPVGMGYLERYLRAIPLEDRKSLLEKLDSALKDEDPNRRAKEAYIWWLWAEVDDQEKEIANGTKATGSNDKPEALKADDSRDIRLVGSPPDGAC